MVNYHNLSGGHSFWQASGSHEIDLNLDKGGRLYSIEIKSGRTINTRFFDSLTYFQSLSGARPEESFIVYGGDEIQQRSIAQELSWKNIDRIRV